MAGVKGFANVLDQPLWHRQTLSGTVNSQQFFNAGGPNKQVTNLTQANQLPGKNRFLCYALRIYVDPDGTPGTATVIADLNEFLRGIVSIRLDDITQFEAPIWDCPAAAGVGGFSEQGGLTGAAANIALQNGSYARTQFRRFAKPIKIDPQESFSVQMDWPALAFSPTANVVVTTMLDGIYTRQPK